MRSLLVLAVALTACKRSESVDPVDPDLVRLGEDRVVKTDLVGDGKFERPATFVLVDADNTTKGDLHVTLAGTLRDADGKDVGTLRPESLRIPVGGRRTFVLVDDQDLERPTAVGANVVVRGAVPPQWSATARLTDPHVFDDHGRVVIAAEVANEADRPGKVIVFAGFHDGDGRPMERQFSLQEMGPGVKQVVRFAGPLGSKTGYVFLGDMAY